MSLREQNQLLLQHVGSQPDVHPSPRLLHPTVEIPLQSVGRLAPLWVGAVGITVRATVGEDPLHVSKEQPTAGVVATRELLRDSSKVCEATREEEERQRGWMLTFSHYCVACRHIHIMSWDWLAGVTLCSSVSVGVSGTGSNVHVPMGYLTTCVYPGASSSVTGSKKGPEEW